MKKSKALGIPIKLQQKALNKNPIEQDIKPHKYSSFDIPCFTNTEIPIARSMIKMTNGSGTSLYKIVEHKSLIKHNIIFRI